MARSFLSKSVRCDVLRKRTIKSVAVVLISALACIVVTIHLTLPHRIGFNSDLLHSRASTQYARKLFEHEAYGKIQTWPAHPEEQQNSDDAAGSNVSNNNSSSFSSEWSQLLQAMSTLGSVGVQLDGVQLMQLDRMRLHSELHLNGQLQQRRVALTAGLATSAVTNNTTSSHVSRGILIVAGSRDQMANALVTIITIQQVLNCTLPIEVVYYGQKEYDPLTTEILREYNSTTGGGRIQLIDGYSKAVDLGYHFQGPAAKFGNARNITSFATKAHALAYVTSFHQVLMLDADNLPLINPEEMFDSEPFAASGNLFWPDFWRHLWMDGDFFMKLGQAVPWEDDPTFNSAESGQVMIDRLQHVDVLEWLFWLNAHSNVTYAHMHGDKDTFRLAFALAGKLSQHRQVTTPPRDALSLVINGSMVYFKHQGMVQHTPDEKPAFLHRTDTAKFFPYCASNPNSSDCYAAFFTIPLTEAQAYLAMQQGMKYSFSQVDLNTFKTQCKSDVQLNPDRPDDPKRCPSLNEGKGTQPVPLVPIYEFGNISDVLRASYWAFESVKQLVEIREQSVKAAVGATSAAS